MLNVSIIYNIGIAIASVLIWAYHKYMTRGSTTEDKRKHLEFIQAVINRMASNSFLFKGWSITIIAGVSAFAAQDPNPALMVVPVVATLLFWAIDAYYLMLERSFRKLYTKIAATSPDRIDYSMNVTEITITDWLKIAFGRPVLSIFYATVLIMLVMLALYLNNYSLEVRIINGS